LAKERTPADDYRDAHRAYIEAEQRHVYLNEKAQTASNEAQLFHRRLIDAQQQLHDWIIGGD